MASWTASECIGVREVDTDAPVDADTVFQLASVSKPIASTVVAAVVGEGLVAWDDPIVVHDRGFQMYQPWVTSQVTLRDMFAHRSGLPEHAGDLLEDIGVAVLTNAAPIGVAESIAFSFLDLAITGSLERDYLTLLTPVFEALAAPPYGTTIDYARSPANPAPPLPLDAYAGTYQNAFFGDIEIVVDSGGLVLHVGPDQLPFALQHWDRDVFLYQPCGENAYGLSGLSFKIGPDQTAVAVPIEYFDIHGQGTFTKAPSRE